MVETSWQIGSGWAPGDSYMIGGMDIRIATNAGAVSLEAAVRAVRQCWPVAEFENGITGERYHEFFQIPFGQIEEIFIYKDRDSADHWDELGAVPELCNSMIHLIIDPGLITVVVDERNDSVEEILGTISSALRLEERK
jgi:hypothetical protein